MKPLLEQLIDAENGMRKYFGISFKKMQDDMLTMIFNRPMIDIHKLDQWVNAPEGTSIFEQIERKYGTEAVEWLDNTFFQD